MSSLSSIERQSWISLSSIQVGGSICLPVIMIGHVLCHHYGFQAALIAILIGNFFLFLLSLAATSMGATSRKSTIEHTSLYFGNLGSKLFAYLMIVCMLGWFSIQLNMMHLSLVTLTGKEGGLHLNTLILGGAMTFFVMNGLNMMGRIANLFVPFLLIILAWVLWDIPVPKNLPENTFPFHWNAISLVMATSISSVIDLPNFFKYARSERDGIVTIALLFGLATPLIEGIGVYIAYALPHLSLLEALQSYGSGKWSACFLLIGGWITNNANLFSAMISAEKLFPNISNKMRIFYLGVGGTLMACLNPAEHLEGVVDLMGVAVGSMGGIIMTGHLLGISQPILTNSVNYALFWSCGMGIGLLAMFGQFSFTGIAVLDAFVIAAMLTLIKYFLKRKK